MHGISYLRVARGRWKVIVAMGLVGLVVGGVVTSMKGDPVRPRRLFGASHTLVIEPGNDNTERRRGGEGAAQSLEATALLVTVGQVPEDAARKLGLDVDELVSKVTTASDSDVGVLQITATDRNGDRAAEISNVLAAELLASLAGQAQQRHAAEVAKADALTADLKRQLDGLPALPQGAQPDPVKDAPREELGKQYQAAADQAHQLRTKAPPTAGFVTLQEATPVPVDPAALAEQKQPDRRARGGPSQSPIEATPVAAAPSRPDEPPDKRLVLLVAGAMGLLLGAGLALLLERLDPRVRTRANAEAATGLPVIAEVPRLSRRRRRRPQIATQAEPSGLEADSYRQLRSALLFGNVSDLWIAPAGNNSHATSVPGGNGKLQLSTSEPEPLTLSGPDAGATREGARLPVPSVAGRDLGAILVTSPAMGEGKTTTAVNLAAVLGEAGKSVVVLDLDLRRSQMHRFFEEPAGARLGELLNVGVEPALAELDRVVPRSGVRFLLSGDSAPNPSKLLPAERKLVSEARRQADLVLVDVPPLLATSDAAELIPVVDAVLLVLRAGKTTMEAANRATERLAMIGTPVLGAVLTEAPILPAARSYHRRRGGLHRRPVGRAVAEAPTPGSTEAATAIPEREPEAEVVTRAPGVVGKRR